jgi:hypothetical protein
VRTEERIERALHDEADARPVDLQRLYVDTRDRLGSGTERTRVGTTPARRRGTVLVAAAALGAIAGGVAWFGSLIGGADTQPAGPAHTVEGGLASTFTCPAQRTIDYGPGNTDDSFLPELTPDRKPSGEAADAPRWDVTERDGLSVLRLGDTDGTLASRTTFRRVGDRYERVKASVCTGTTGNLVPVDGSDRLGDHPGAGGPEQYTAEDFAPGAVQLDARSSYDARGFARRRTLWVEPCDGRICVTAGSKTATTTLSTLRSDPTRPRDLTGHLADPDDVVGLEPPYRLFAVYDRDAALSRVSWDTRDGKVTWVEPVPGGGWAGRLFLVFVRSEELGAVTLHPREGASRNFTADQIRD